MKLYVAPHGGLVNYVELTYLDVANHGAEFQMLMSDRLPRHASLCKELNEFIALPYRG